MERITVNGSSEIIGILGGMGPAATADFYAKLVSLTPASTDQEHPRTVIWSDPTVPDRTAALLQRGPDPTPWLLRGSEILHAAGATLIAIPCNTAHAFLPGISEQVGLPIVHMIDAVTQHLAAMQPPVRVAGLLATTGTTRAGLYQEWLERAGISAAVPDETSQETEVMPAIRALKAGVRGAAVAQPLARAAGRLIRQGAQAVIAGCTEIPLGLDPECLPVPVVDPALVLARAVLARARTVPWEAE
ncbi:cysteate racemase [Streptomyces lydicus]|uniref:aspartate/glutamate racemase family protein n=1 Tax=Streptomyces lydicus TaxID=47763 RepID=UPI0036E12256